ALTYGNRLMQLPLGVFGVAIATALLPVTSACLARGEKKEFIATLSFGLRLLFIITVPAAVGIIVLSEPINRLLFEYGRFSPAAVSAVAQATIFYTLGLVAYAGVKVIVPTFYALSDAKTPVMVAVCAVVVNIVLNLLLMKPMGYRGLALATTIAAFVNMSLLVIFLHRRLGTLDGRKIIQSLFRVCLAAAGMGFLIWSGSQRWLPDYGVGMPRWELAYKVFSLIIFGVFAYFAFAWFFKVPEQARVWRLIRKKVGLRGTSESWME
ncbi:polysaccharide biosynthesis C-terminal domain-containing protein, partial [bacterium]|nr:polysaccharide biosynthesis C-terminal domain-containing protein [bacterium]